MKPADENRRESSLVWAVLDCLQNAQNWMGGAVVVKDGNEYEAHPGAYMNDISYTGSRDVVFTVTDPADVLGSYTTLDDFESEDDLIDYLKEQVIPSIAE
jgi:hypothetical protein